ncbi:MAG: hypothetical protein ACOCPX_01230 [Halapricum sp.]
MTQSRREFVLATTGVGAVLLAGCLGRASDSPADGGNGGDDGNGDSGDRECDPIDLELIDDPPHGPERPPQPDDIDDEWDDHYLGSGMDDDSDLSFDRIDLRFRASPVNPVAFDGESVFYAELLTSREEFDERVEPVGEESTDRVDEIDFEEEAVVAVLSGFDSSSVCHEWVRAEQHCEDVHLHGYDVRPYVQTSDHTSRVSGVVVEKPEDDIDRVWVSLTVGEDSRANFHTDDDIQVVTDDDGSDDESAEGSGTVDQVDVVAATRGFSGQRTEENT